MKYKAIFLDKNGTLTPEFAFIAEPAGISFNESIIDGLQRFQSNGYLLIVVSDQPAIAQGYLTAGDMDVEKDSLYHSCAHLGIYLDGFYYCPHDSNGKVPEYAHDCACRKPFPGLLLKAANDMDIDLSQSWMIGDVLNDVEVGNRAGCKSVMINDGNEKKWTSGSYRFPEYFARDLTEAAKYIIASDKMRRHESAGSAKVLQH